MATYIIDPAVGMSSTDSFIKRRIARASNGRLWCIYDNVWGIYCAYSDDNGVTWTTETVVTDTYRTEAAALAIDSHDNLHAVWKMRGVGSYPAKWQIAYCKRTAAGWGSIEYVTDINADQYVPAIAVDSGNSIHVAWPGLGWGTNPAVYNIQYRKRTTSWQSQESVTDSAGWGGDGQYTPCLAIDSANSIHLVWYGYGWGSYPAISQIQYRKRTSGGWQAQELITDDAGNSGNGNYDPSIALTVGNEPHVAWDGYNWDPSDRTIRCIMHSWHTTAWQTPELLGSGGDTTEDATIATDLAGNIYVAWCPYIARVDYRKKTAGVWQATVTLVDGTSPGAIYPCALWAYHPMYINFPLSGLAITVAYGLINNPAYSATDDLAWMVTTAWKGNILIDQLIYQHCERMVR